MGMGSEAPAPPVAPPPPGAFSGPKHAADLVYGDGPMADARAEMREMHGSLETYKVLIDQLEAKIRDGRDGYAWDGQAWYGGDIDKIWLKTEGEGAFGETVERAEVQALWSRAIDPWFDLQAGVRYDFRPDPERAYLVLGVQGLAPYWFEVDGAAFVSNKGDVSARVEAEYDLRLTRKLILQPRLELDLALQDIPEIDIGSGLSSGELGARLRYEIRPEFAPYIGVEYERAFGGTRDFRRAAGEDAGGWSLLLGLRTWF
jgi:copper resistance protein B